MWVLEIGNAYRVRLAFSSKKPSIVSRILWRLLGCKIVDLEFPWGAEFKGDDRDGTWEIVDRRLKFTEKSEVRGE